MRFVVVLSISLSLSALGCGTGPAPDAGDVLDVRDAVSLDVAADALDAIDAADVGDGASEAADAPPGTWCSLGTDVPGAIVPAEFCIRQFAAPSLLVEPRVMAFAPNGDLFVSAPRDGTAGGAGGGPGAILVLSDDNHDGVAEITTFASGLHDVHGLAFGSDGLYFTTTAGVFRTNYATGQRAESVATRTMVAPFGTGVIRWTHGVGVTPGNTVYATTGVYGAMCPDPNVGTVDRVDSGALTTVERGFRNPMYIRCHFRDEMCLVSELGDDGGGTEGAHEKIVAIHPGANYGFPCCHGVDTPSTGVATSMCTATLVTMEDASFPLNSTPFGMDWERGVWPATYRNALFYALHGSYYTCPKWSGTRIVFAPTDPTTHLPSAAFQDFVTGFGPATGTSEACGHPGPPQLRRATDVAFGPDGRLYFVDDIGGGAYWIAPRSLTMP